MPDIFTNDTAPAKRNKVVIPPQGGPLSAFRVQPHDVRFETQQDDEEVILFLRQHFVVNMGWILATIVLVIIPLIVVPLLASSAIIPAEIPGAYFFVIPLLWYVGVFGFTLVNFLHWYFNIYIVTNERIVDIDWINLLYKQLSSTKLDKVQDVSFKQHGLLDLFFNFGNVFIQTAGSEQNFEFHSVPRADLVVKQINSLIEKNQP